MSEQGEADVGLIGLAGMGRILASGVSGGEVGARFGPSWMPGGKIDAWTHLEPIWKAIAAKVDTDTGKPIEVAKPGQPVAAGEPYTAYIGPPGAGHDVKVVHNGTAYIDMLEGDHDGSLPPFDPSILGCARLDSEPGCLDVRRRRHGESALTKPIHQTQDIRHRNLGMHQLSRDDLKQLMSPRAGMHISIYMPTYRAGGMTRQNPIRFKNMLREAEAQLLATALPRDMVQALLEPLQPFTDDHDFWQHQSDGLAVFRRAETLRLFRLPMAFEELVIVGKQFHLKPLLPYLTRDGHFYVLAISQNAVRMLQCTQDHVSEIELHQVPQNLSAALQVDDPEQQLQFHTGTPGGGGKRAAIYHGQGGGKEIAKDEILAYFHQIDQGLHDILRDEEAPLVLAGVDYLHPIYQQANTYRHLTEEGITGNCEHLTVGELQAKAWRLVEPIFRRAQADARATYERYAATEQASDDIATIVPAAHYGRVDTLFVTVGVQQWGTFDPATQQLQFPRDDDDGAATDLLNLAAVQTLLNGGTVYAVAADQMPTKHPLAAIFRY